jgi:acyl-CoA synthetase (AMP-forming)/AMP-acid ligase II
MRVPLRGRGRCAGSGTGAGKQPMSKGDMRIPDILARWASERPDAEALKHAERSWTWAALADRVARAAAAQGAEGLRPGSRIATLDQNHPSCLETTLACAYAGTVHVVVNSRLAPSEIEYVLNDSDAEVLLVGPDFVQMTTEMRARLPRLRTVIRVGGETDEYEAWLNIEPPHAAYPAEQDECFLQLYTSGTTGFPKGAEITHRGMLAHSAAVADLLDADPSSSFLVAMPLFHVGGTSYAMAGLYAGARLVVTRTPDPALLLSLLDREQITHAFFVPALLATMVAASTTTKCKHSTLRSLCYGASPMPLPQLRDSMRLFPGVLVQVYGMTEACGTVAALLPDDHEVESLHTSAGKPIDGVRIEIRDLLNGTPLAAGEKGEVWVATEQLIRGYWKNPDATASAITPDGWYRSGDAGHIDENGYLFVTDRIKDMIISGAENIYPAEIERVLAAHPDVADVTVIGVPDLRWGEVPKAVVVAAGGRTVDESALLTYARKHLASYKCPKSVEVVEELPRNPTGKILKAVVRAKYGDGQDG